MTESQADLFHRLKIAFNWKYGAEQAPDITLEYLHSLGDVELASIPGIGRKSLAQLALMFSEAGLDMKDFRWFLK